MLPRHSQHTLVRRIIAEIAEYLVGGLPHIARVDIRGSRNFLAKLGVGSKSGQRVAASALEGGAG